MKLKPANQSTKAYVENGIRNLKKARAWFTIAGAPKAARAVSRALKSAEGALRHVERRMRVREEPCEVCGEHGCYRKACDARRA